MVSRCIDRPWRPGGILEWSGVEFITVNSVRFPHWQAGEPDRPGDSLSQQEWLPEGPDSLDHTSKG